MISKLDLFGMNTHVVEDLLALALEDDEEDPEELTPRSEAIMLFAIQLSDGICH